MIDHASDCAVHNEPASPARPCNCGAEAPTRTVLTLRIALGSTQSFYVTCDQHKGLLTCERSLSASLASVVPALQELLAAGPAHPDPHAFDGVEIS